jgi:hypothetical protein
MRRSSDVWVDRVMLLLAAVLLLPIVTIAALPFLPVLLIVLPMLALTSA